MFSWKGLSFITSAVGEPDRLHPEAAQCLDFKVAKVFAKADLTKQLPSSMHFNHKGKDALIEFAYLKLPIRCRICQKLGHLHSVCVVNKGESITVQEQSQLLTEEKTEEKVMESLEDVQPAVEISDAVHGTSNEFS